MKQIAQSEKTTAFQSNQINYISDSDLEDLIELLFPEEAELYSMLVAYLDESTSFGEKVPVAAVGGIVGTGKQCAQLTKAWRKVLDAEDVEIFHTSEFETPEGRIGTVYENWDKSKREDFHNSLILDFNQLKGESKARNQMICNLARN
jgi:hypothetical protein